MILITGGTGFLGRTPVPALLEGGEEVRLLARDPRLAGELFPRAEAVKGDILDLPSLQVAAKDCDQAIHLAALISYTCPREELSTSRGPGTSWPPARKLIGSSFPPPSPSMERPRGKPRKTPCPLPRRSMGNRGLPPRAALDARLGLYLAEHAWRYNHWKLPAIKQLKNS